MARRSGASRKNRPTRSAPVRWLIATVKAGTALVLGYLLACTLLLVAYRWVEPPATTVQIQRLMEAAIASEPFELRYAPVGDAEQDPDVRHAAIASEDGRFYSHNGFDWEEIRIAREEAAREGRAPRGASTITQQLVKNLFLTTHRSYIRKGMEVPLTLIAEMVLPKDRILTLYLNAAEWGPGVFGIEAAARQHYGTSADALTRAQAARLVAVLPAPLSRRPQDMGQTAARIQRRMSQMGW
ncbi:MAG: monofunctional biosynthetic peptidoglycan transglycosylase [Bacteroidota bacterium]